MEALEVCEVLREQVESWDLFVAEFFELAGFLDPVLEVFLVLLMLGVEEF